MKAYLSGPMIGQRGYNFEAFNEAERELAATGLFSEIVNPAKLGQQEDRLTNAEAEQRYQAFMRRDLKAVLDDCDLVIVLPGWQGSAGSLLEVMVAMFTGVRVIELTDVLMSDIVEPADGSEMYWTPGTSSAVTLPAGFSRELQELTGAGFLAALSTCWPSRRSGKYTEDIWRREHLLSHAGKGARHALTHILQQSPEAKSNPDGEPHLLSATTRCLMEVANEHRAGKVHLAALSALDA